MNVDLDLAHRISEGTSSHSKVSLRHDSVENTRSTNTISGTQTNNPDLLLSGAANNPIPIAGTSNLQFIETPKSKRISTQTFNRLTRFLTLPVKVRQNIPKKPSATQSVDTGTQIADTTEKVSVKSPITKKSTSEPVQLSLSTADTTVQTDVIPTKQRPFAGNHRVSSRERGKSDPKSKPKSSQSKSSQNLIANMPLENTSKAKVKKSKVPPDKPPEKPPSESSDEEGMSVLQAMVEQLTVMKGQVAKSSNRRPVYQNIPNFAGADNESYEQWQDKFQSSALLHDWPQQKQILLLHQALTDRAFAYYQNLPDSDKVTIDTVFAALKSRFGLASKNIMMRLQELNRKQGPDEDVATYTKDILAILERLEMRDAAANINQYLAGLKPEIQDKMLLMKPVSLRDAELNALLLEKANKENPETKLLATLKTLTEEMRKEHAKTVDSAASVQLQVAHAQAEMDATTQPRSPASPNSFQRQPYNARQTQSYDNRSTGFPRPQFNQQRSYTPRYNNNYSQRPQGQRPYQSQPPRYQANNQYQYPANNQYQAQPNQRNFSNGYQRNNQQPYNNQRTNSSPFCRQCNVPHTFGQHIVNLSYGQHQQPNQGTQQTSYQPNLNAGGQTAPQ